MTEPTISAGHPKALLEFAISRGADRGALIQRAGIRAEDLSEQDNRVPLARYVALMEASIELCRDSALALKFGEAVRMQDISIVGLICEACETTAEVGVQLNRYARLVVDDDRSGQPELIRTVRTEEGVWVKIADGEDNAHLVEAELARFVWNARIMFASNSEFQKQRFPIAVHFMQAEPSYRAEHERIFNAPVVFGSRWNAVLIEPSFLSLRQPPTSRYVFGVLSEKAQALLNEIESATTARALVERALAPILQTGATSMNVIAKKLGMSRQKLYRALKAEGVTFEEVLDELRHKLAVHYLSGRKVSVNETAYLVGFSDPSAFSRAFKRWTGTSPRDARGTVLK